MGNPPVVEVDGIDIVISRLAHAPHRAAQQVPRCKGRQRDARAPAAARGWQAGRLVWRLAGGVGRQVDGAGRRGSEGQLSCRAATALVCKRRLAS